MFRLKRSIPLSYARQGYICFRSLMYDELTERQREIIRDIARRAGGEHAAAVLRFVTTEEGATKISMEHHISRETLDRAVRKYYLLFPKNL